MAQVMKAKREENIPVLSGRLVDVCFVYHKMVMGYPMTIVLCHFSGFFLLLLPCSF